ncbi:MAG: TetR/AcrR family transcriptional regulator [Bifidobacteriaceae bacterium]|jgi:AcrR family transcriptional regulator|nr:TetR/AcrR family transcriptional regulator [Bifidobacteriaceae bacterium]
MENNRNVRVQDALERLAAAAQDLADAAQVVAQQALPDQPATTAGQPNSEATRAVAETGPSAASNTTGEATSTPTGGGDGEVELLSSPCEAKATGRSSRSTSTKQALLEAAAKVIAAKGYAVASMDDIAAAAGFTKGALYSHFATKEDLFVAVVDQVNEAHGPAPAKGVLSQNIRRLGGLIEADHQLMALEAMNLALRSPSFRDRINPAMVKTFEIGSRWVAADRGAEEPTDQDIYTAIGLFAVINVARMTAHAFLSAKQAAGCVDFLVDRILVPPTERAGQERSAPPAKST